jgi:hypothetical protein
MQIAHKTYPHLNAPVGPFVHAVSYNGLLFSFGSNRIQDARLCEAQGTEGTDRSGKSLVLLHQTHVSTRV